MPAGYRSDFAFCQLPSLFHLILPVRLGLLNKRWGGDNSEDTWRCYYQPVRARGQITGKNQDNQNQVIWAAFAAAIGSCRVFVAGLNIVDGILAQLASIADGVDRDSARSRFGRLLDATLDRYGDAAIVLGVTLWSLAREPIPAPGF